MLLVSLLAPARAHAEEPAEGINQVAAKQRAAESEQLAAQGFEAYKAGNYETALQFYDQALDAHPAAALYFNVARIYETKLSAPDKAIEYYRKTLKAPDVTEALVEKSLARIRVLTALLEQPNPPEGKVPPPKPAEPPVGQPPPAERQPQAAAPDERAASQGSTQRTLGYVVGITGLVAAGAGLGLGGWALVERDEARKTCDGNQCTTEDGVDSMNTAYDLATASTITLAVGGALSVVGFGMVLLAPPRKPAEQDSAKAPPAAGRTGVQLGITPTFGGAQLQFAGAFF